jgi:hypothetical protein
MSSHNTTDNRYKDCYIPKPTRLLKKAHCISNKMLVVLDENLVQGLSIDDDTWFEQLQTDDGILLKLRRLQFTDSC